MSIWFVHYVPVKLISLNSGRIWRCCITLKIVIYDTSPLLYPLQPKSFVLGKRRAMLTEVFVPKMVSILLLVVILHHLESICNHYCICVSKYITTFWSWYLLIFNGFSIGMETLYMNTHTDYYFCDISTNQTLTFQIRNIINFKIKLEHRNRTKK